MYIIIIADSPGQYNGTTINTCRGRNIGTLILSKIILDVSNA